MPTLLFSPSDTLDRGLEYPLYVTLIPVSFPCAVHPSIELLPTYPPFVTLHLTDTFYKQWSCPTFWEH